MRIDPHSRYRYYNETQIQDARLIIMLRGLDMPLATIRDILAMSDLDRAAAVTAYWEVVESTRSAQRHLAAYVVSVITPDRERTMSVHTREIGEMTYLTECKQVTPEQIPGFIGDSCERLAAVAENFGGWAGPLTTIYRSPVNEDSAGQIENAVPVGQKVRPEDLSAPTNLLIEPAGELAYTRITKAQVQFPQILQAYDEVYAWLTEQDLVPSAPPREIYFPDFPTAAPDEEVCDIAVPFTR